jgi:hypothetical protein
MSQALTELTFEQWRSWVFDHPVANPAWHFDLDADFWDEERVPTLTVDYLTRLFEEPCSLPALFSDAQIAQGLWFLADNSCSNHMFALADEAVSWSHRERGLRSMFVLFRDLFAPVCADRLSHGLTSAGRSPLDDVCYMWWDLHPLPFAASGSERARVSAVILDVLRETLLLPSPACQEGALHGLGHLYFDHPREVQRIIDEFLGRNSRLLPALHQYARSARTGSVL